MDYSIRNLRHDELAVIEPIARDFFVEAKYPGEFAYDTFANFWEPMLSQGYGEVFIATVKERVVGLVGALFSPSLFNGQLTMMFHFWYARPEVRRITRVGVDLFDMMMLQARIRDVSAVLAGHILTINEDGCQKFFERRGFVLREMVYRKELK